MSSRDAPFIVDDPERMSSMFFVPTVATVVLEM